MIHNGTYKGIKYWVDNSHEPKIESSEKEYIEQFIDALPFNEYITLLVNQQLKDIYPDMKIYIRRQEKE